MGSAFRALRLEPMPSRQHGSQPANSLSAGGSVRAEMVGWIVQVQEMFILRVETLFLAVRIVDRFHAAHRALPQKPLLVCSVAVLIAAKFEEVTPPTQSDLVEAGHFSFTQQDAEQMELTMLHKLEFRLHQPTAFHYLVGFETALVAGRRNHEPSSSCNCPFCLFRALAVYLCELGLACPACATWMPSIHAAGAVLLAARLLKLAWPGTHKVLDIDTHVRAKQVQDIIRKLQEALAAVHNGRAIHRKNLMLAGDRVTKLQQGDAVSALEAFNAEYEDLGSGRILSGASGVVDKVLPDGSGIIAFSGGRFLVLPRNFHCLCHLVFSELAAVVQEFGVPLKEISVPDGLGR